MEADIQSAINAIHQAPGPVPWYLGQPANDLSTAQQPLGWYMGTKSGFGLLADGAGYTFGAAAMYAYIHRVGTHALIWKVEASQNARSAGQIHLALYTLEKLRPLQSVPDSSSMKNKSFFCDAPPEASVTLPADQLPGTHCFNFPPALKAMSEIFVLVSEFGYQSSRVDLWILWPANSEICVVPQSWFTTGPYDFGYQWITRITRDPITRNVVGDGIRIKGFVLNPEATDFIRWIDEPTTLPPKRPPSAFFKRFSRALTLRRWLQR